MKTLYHHKSVLFIPEGLGTLLVWLALFFASPAFATIHYVKPIASGSGNGTSWSNASSNLQAMINMAAPGDEIWVAAGAYLPTTTTVRTVYFSMKNGVAIFGGFFGNENQISDRDWLANVTVLSGDIGIPGDKSDNSYHVIYNSGLNSSAVLDGFTITGGNADDGGTSSAGGGMYNESASPTIVNCIFSDNSAKFGGGGMRNGLSSPTVINCIFSGNTANNGGGMWNSVSSPVLTNCTFTGNTSSSAGGGMVNTYSSSSTLVNCSFTGNSATTTGGGMSNFQSSPNLTSCSFSENTAVDGGGIYNNQASSPVLNAGVFTGNTASLTGGGICNRQASSPVLTNITFSANSADTGGGIYNEQSSPVLTGCHFNENAVNTHGGGIYNRQYSAPLARDCSFSGNSANLRGGGMYNIQSSSIANNCVFEGNTADFGGGIYSELSSSPTVGNCLFSNNLALGQGGGMYNSNCSPVITDCSFSGNTSNFGGGIYNFSAAVNIATSNFLGNVAYVQGGGILNRLASPILTDCAFSGNTAGDFGGGMYNYKAFPELTACTFSDGNTATYGGGMGNESASPKLTNCSFSGNTCTVFGGGMYNYLSSSPILTDCYFTGNTSGNEGGGMHNNQSSSPVLTNCVFTGNTTVYKGGGMCNQISSSPKLFKCTFSGNTSEYHGGAILNSESSLELTECLFVDGNYSPYGSGGIFNHMYSTLIVNKCVFSGNSSGEGAGIFNHYSSSATLLNSIFYNNSSWEGGALSNAESDMTVTNCSFSGNYAENGSAVSAYNSSLVMTNCVLWDDGNGDEIYDYNNSNSIIVTYSIVKGGFPGTGNLDADPLFVDISDLHLQACSPAIDAGTATSAPLDDLDGNIRPFDAKPEVAANFDMGAYEFLDLVPDPVATCQNITIQLDAGHSAWVTGSDIDNSSTGCGPLVFLLNGQTELGFDCDDVGIPQNVTLSVTDNFGKSDNCAAIIYVADDENPCCATPTAICQAYTAQLDASGVATIHPDDVNGGSAAECGLLSRTVVPDQFDCSHAGTSQTVTLTIVDINGNSDNCTATVTVLDVINPVALCHDITVEPNGSGIYYITPAMVDDGSYDNCEATLSIEPETILCFHTAYQQTVTLTATDPSGNLGYCTTVVTLTGDTDCDGVSDACDVCPGGNDQVDNNGDNMPDCKVYPGFNYLPADWKCSNNNNNQKVYICHMGETICVSVNAVAAHLAHGDYIGLCDNSTCGAGERNTMLEKGKGIFVFPNPTNGRLMVLALESYTGNNSIIEINSVVGTLIQTHPLDALTGEVIELNLENLASGTYFLTVRSNGVQTKTLRFVVQNN